MSQRKIKTVNVDDASYEEIKEATQTIHNEGVEKENKNKLISNDFIPE